MGFWSSIFPGDEGKLADILWSSSTPSNGIILADSTYKGTKNDDTVIFGSKFLSYNPYKSNIYLYEGNDAIEFTDTASIVYVDLGNGDLNVLKSSDSFKYSTLLGGSGNDLFLFRPGGWGTDNLFNSTLDAKAGQDVIIFSKDKNRKYEDAILIKSNILLGDGNDRVVIDFFGRVSDGSTIKLEEGDDYLILLDQLQNADGAILDNLDIDGGGGNDTIDLSQIKIKSANALSLNGGNGFDILIAPEGFETSQFKSLFECIYVAGIQVSGDATARVSSSSVLNLDTLNIVLTGTSSISATGNLKNNLLLGNSGSNTLNGGGGDDTMAGGAGDDLIVGGGGTDIAVFSGKYLDYKITVLTDNSLTIYDNRGIDGTDQIKDISILRFSEVDKNVNDLTPAHTYTLTPSTATINEGAVLTSTVTTTNVATGTQLYYALSGTGITIADFSAGTITGEGITDATGKFTFTHTLANDLTTEGGENLSIKLYSDAARTLHIGATATVSIVDSSTTPVPTYTLTPSLATISEGEVLTNTVATTNVGSGTKFYYSLSGTGITTADFSAGALTGEGVTNATGKFSFSHTLANDLTTEGAEILSIKLYSDVARTTQVGTTASVSVVDSSAIAPSVQSLTLNPPSKTAIRSGVNTTSAISYTVSTGEINLTGVGASLYFDSTQLSVSIAGDPFKIGLLGNAITADTSNADGDPKTDKVLSLSYADFGGNFPGSGTTLPLTLANLNLVPTNTFSGSTLHLKGDPAVGFTATGADLSIAHNSAPVVNGSIPALSTNRYTPFSYTLKSDLFSDPDSSITLSATTNTGDTLPSWLSFNPTTRTLSGTPTTGGTINLNLSATDELGSVSTPLTLKIREVQSLSSATTPIRYQRNKELSVPINYSTSDGSSTTGLSFKVHFNSSLLSFDSTTGVTNKAQADLFQIGATQQDTANSDNDATTDSFIPINIASFTGQFPTAGVPVKLADLIFKSLDKPIDPITGLKDTFINFTESEAASGYGFTATSASLKPLSFSLDVDRDGKVTALGDGLMIIRKLFGAAFAGDALINKAISPDSPYLNGIAYNTLTTQQKADVAAQVHANIQEGIDSKMLDVDKDGKTTALGDGLMVIRHLFGAAFAGAALTNKAISPDSPYFGPPANFAAVAANIDAMRPV